MSTSGSLADDDVTKTNSGLNALRMEDNTKNTSNMPPGSARGKQNLSKMKSSKSQKNLIASRKEARAQKKAGVHGGIEGGLMSTLGGMESTNFDSFTSSTKQKPTLVGTTSRK